MTLGQDDPDLGAELSKKAQDVATKEDSVNERGFGATVSPGLETSAALPWNDVRRRSRWLDVRMVKLRRARDHATRALGLLSVVARSGPATRQPRFHEVLRRLGVLDGDTRSAMDSPLLERMPWGSKPVAAPAPAKPPGVEGMWPQAPVFHPDIYPGVLHLSRREHDEHTRTNALRYLGQIVALTPPAAWRARTRPRVLSVDDATFSSILTVTSLAQHLRHTFNAADRASFAPHIEGSLDGYAKIDFSGVQPGPTLPGVHLTPTVTLFRRHADGRYEPRAIRVRDTVFTQADGDAWSLARYHVLSGVHIQHTVIVHPRLHFPSDVVNAVSKSILPAGHSLAQLILPHTRFTLGLDLAVSHHRRSVLYNSQREIYTGLPLDTDGICAAVRLGRTGAPDAVSYPEYDFWGIEHDRCTLFGRYCAEWQAAFERFACEIVHRIPAGDPDVARWADTISAWVPGFPDGRRIFVGDGLGRAVGRYLASVTVLHSGDHHSYAAIPIEYLPMRIRQPAPTERWSDQVDLENLVSVEDFFRHILNHEMFFKPVVVESLDEVRYGFDREGERQAVKRFRDVQAELDARWWRSGFPASHEIASSIQY